VILDLGPHRIDCTHRSVVMGILNVSLDSPVRESVVAPAEALRRALELRAAGAAIVDVGAHSTRTGAQQLTPAEEIERLAPTVEAIAREGIPVSVDTWNAEVARAALDAGAVLLNDVSAASDPAMAALAAERGAAICVMHMRGTPQRHAEVDQTYADINAEVHAFLEDRALVLEGAGTGQVWLDPGFGFGKSAADNGRMLEGLPALVSLGRPVLVSASRKGFLAELLGQAYSQQAPGLLEATLAFNTLAARQGAHVLRVHDVAEVARVVRVVNAVRAHTLAG
jgi:dihydropteroate synthase